MLTFNDCFYQYRLALQKLITFEKSDKMENLKGHLEYKNKKKIKNKKEYFFKECYFVKVKYVNGKRSVKSTYIRKADVENFEEKMKKKKENQKEYCLLLKNEKRLAAKVRRAMRKEGVDYDIEGLKDSLLAHAKYRNAEKERNEKQGIKVPEVSSVFGEPLRSRAEGLLSSLAYAFQLPYDYEPEVKIGKYESLRPDFSFLIKGKKVLLELMGMVDDTAYQSRWKEKENKYRRKGYERGKNLVCIACNDKQGIDAQKMAQALKDLKEGRFSKEIIRI